MIYYTWRAFTARYRVHTADSHYRFPFTLSRDPQPHHSINPPPPPHPLIPSISQPLIWQSTSVWVIKQWKLNCILQSSNLFNSCLSVPILNSQISISNRDQVRFWLQLQTRNVPACPPGVRVWEPCANSQLRAEVWLTSLQHPTEICRTNSNTAPISYLGFKFTHCPLNNKSSERSLLSQFGHKQTQTLLACSECYNLCFPLHSGVSVWVINWFDCFDRDRERERERERRDPPSSQSCLLNNPEICPRKRLNYMQLFSFRSEKHNPQNVQPNLFKTANG